MEMFPGAISAIILGIKKGLNFGVDFVGGRTYVVRFDETINNEDLRASLSAVFVETLSWRYESK